MSRKYSTSSDGEMFVDCPTTFYDQDSQKTDFLPFKHFDLKKLTKDICSKVPLDSSEKVFTPGILPTDDFQRFDKIKKALNAFAKNPSHDRFHSTIMQYSEDKVGEFTTFNYLAECLASVARHSFMSMDEFNKLLGEIAKLALKFFRQDTKRLRILVKDKDQHITLSSSDISFLLANAFFCTFPNVGCQRPNHESRFKMKEDYFESRRNTDFRYSHNVGVARGGTSKMPMMPTFNFFGLFTGGRRGDRCSFDHPDVQTKMEKLKCILHYFRRIVTNPEYLGERRVTFHRQCLIDPPQWSDSRRSLSKVRVFPRGCIEEAHFLLQVDFANKLVGGGVLGRGCVQEEIRFVICPELIVSRLLTEELNDNECLIVTGAEMFSKYQGYSGDFKWDGDFVDKTLMDHQGRRLNQVVVMDALKFSYEKEQFDHVPFTRELMKAYCGFTSKDVSEKEIPAIATGNWGCGAFKGNKELKFLIQLLAASEAGREMCYFTFDDDTLSRRIREMCQEFESRQVDVGRLYDMVIDALPDDKHQRYGRSPRNTQFFDRLNLKTKTRDRSQSPEGSSVDRPTNEFLEGGWC